MIDTDGLFQDIRTKNDLDLLTGEIDLILAGIFKSDLNSVLHDQLRISTANFIKQKFPDFQNQRDAIKDYLTSAKEEIFKFKILKLTLAFEPTPEMIEKIHDWVKENFDKKVVIDLTLDKSILGGAIVVYGGLYRDFSLQKLLSEVFDEKREEITTILKSS